MFVCIWFNVKSIYCKLMELWKLWFWESNLVIFKEWFFKGIDVFFSVLDRNVRDTEYECFKILEIVLLKCFMFWFNGIRFFFKLFLRVFSEVLFFDFFVLGWGYKYVEIYLDFVSLICCFFYNLISF